MISKDLDVGATEADGRASASMGPSVATPLIVIHVLDWNKGVYFGDVI